MKKLNSFDTTVESMADMGADSILVYDLRKNGIATGEPYSSKKKCSWSLSLVSSFKELKECKYPKVVPDHLVKLYEKMEKKK